MVAVSTPTATAATTDTSVSDIPIVGGRGADEPVTTVTEPTVVTDPVTPPVDPPVDPTPVDDVPPVLDPVLPIVDDTVNTVTDLLGL